MLRFYKYKITSYTVCLFISSMALTLQPDKQNLSFHPTQSYTLSAMVILVLLFFTGLIYLSTKKEQPDSLSILCNISGHGVIVAFCFTVWNLIAPDCRPAIRS